MVKAQFGRMVVTSDDPDACQQIADDLIYELSDSCPESLLRGTVARVSCDIGSVIYNIRLIPDKFSVIAQ